MNTSPIIPQINPIPSIVIRIINPLIHHHVRINIIHQRDRLRPHHVCRSRQIRIPQSDTLPALLIHKQKIIHHFAPTGHLAVFVGEDGQIVGSGRGRREVAVGYAFGVEPVGVRE